MDWGHQGGHSWRRMVRAYCTLLGQPKSLPPTIHRVSKRMQIMGVSTTILFGRKWPTVVTWRFGEEAGGEKGKEKQEGWRGSGDHGKSKREGERQKDREGGSGKGREERTVVYSKDDAASNPPWGPWHSSRGTLRCRPNILMHERPEFLEANVARYPVLRTGLRLMPSNQSPEQETHRPPTTTSCSRRLLAKNRHWLYNQPAGRGKWPRLHYNVCRPYDKESTLASQQKNNWRPGFCAHIHRRHCPSTRSASRGCIGRWCTHHSRLLERGC